MKERLEYLQKLFNEKRYEEALTDSHDLRASFKKSPHFWAFIGACEYHIGRIDDAEKSLRYALSLDKMNFDANNNLGSVMLDREEYKKAKKYFEKAAKIDKKCAAAIYNLGKVYRSLNDIPTAKRYFSDAIRLDSKMAFAHNNLGNCLKSEGNLEGAIDAYRCAIAADPEFRVAKWNISLCLLRNEEYEEGYAYYPFGFDLKKEDGKIQRGKYIGDPNREWDGREKCSELIIWGEQGIGDELMFSNFIQYIPQDISKIEVRVQKKMIGIIREKLASDTRVTVSQRNDEMGDLAQIPIGNLPALYWGNYFTDQTQRRPSWSFPKLLGETKRTVGINWRGGATAEARVKRSISLDLFQKLDCLRNSSFEIVPLQYDATPEEISQLRETFGSRLIDLDYDPKVDVDAWAYDIKSCDLLISSDNSAVHIAGEYQIPTIVLLPQDCDSRWGNKGEETIWYPSLKLIRNVDQMSQEQTIAKIEELLSSIDSESMDLDCLESDTNHTHKINNRKQDCMPAKNNGYAGSATTSLLVRQDFSQKGQKLIDQYTLMAKSGYKTTDGTDITSAYNDMEIRRYREHVKPIFTSLNIETLLDYGCGGSDYERGDFFDEISAKQYFGLKTVNLYEPSREIDQRKRSDAVVCFDVLEHIFISDIPRVLREIFSLADKLVILNIAAYSARALLPNGENAHITVRDLHWWKGMVDSVALEYPIIMIKLWVCPTYSEAKGFELYSADNWLKQNSFVTS